MSKICMRNLLWTKKKGEKYMKSSGGVKNNVSLRELQPTPVEHTSGIPKAPKMKGIPTHGEGGFFLSVCSTGLLESS